MCNINKLGVAFVSAFVLNAAIVGAVPQKGINGKKNTSKREVALKQNLRSITPSERNTEENKKLVLAKKTKTGWNREVFGKSFKDWGIFFLKGSAVTAGGFVLYSLLRKLSGYNFWMPTNVDDIKESGLNVDAMNLSVSHKLAEQKENFENVLNASDLDKKTRKNLKAEFMKQENARLDAYREQIKKHVSDEKLARGNRDLKALCEGNNLCASLANVTSSVWAANPAFELSSVNGTTKLIPISVNNATMTNSTVTE